MRVAFAPLRLEGGALRRIWLFLVRWAIRIANQNYVGGGDALRIDERAVA